MNPFDLNQNKRKISYLSTNFDKIKQSLVDYSKYYYPNTYKDFSDGSVGMMFTEQMSYVGDILSFYLDNRLQESLVNYASERKSLINHARSNGYKVRTSVPSQTLIDVYQIVPSKTNVFGEQEVDLSAAQNIKEGMICQTSDSISFVTKEPVDFGINTENSPLSVSVYSRDQLGNPQSYLLKKTVSAFSATKRTITVSIVEPEEFKRIVLDEANVIYVESIFDSEGNRWYEVDYLAQENIPTYENLEPFFSSTSNKSSARSLKYIKTSNKFTTYVTEDNLTTIEFGPGKDNGFDEQVLNSPINPNDKFNYKKTNTYGRAPSNTELTITYYYGGGIESNVVSNSITNISRIEYEISMIDLNPDVVDLYRSVRNSTKITNPIPATGGSGPDTNEEIRQNIISTNHSQKRIVSDLDYESIIYSMSPVYGKADKVCVKKDFSKNNTVNIYVLSSDSEGNLAPPNKVLKQNILKYVDNFRMLSENIQILDGNVINIGVDYKIKIIRGFSKPEILRLVNLEIENFFDSKNQNFFQPIDISQLQMKIGSISGVQSISSILIKNLNRSNGNYSTCEYDINYATRENIIYPSQDPSIFEIKYPSIDIKGTIS